MTTENLVTLIRLLQIYYTIISVVGILINLWAAFDSYQDLRRLHLAKINSLVEKTGRISFRDAKSIIATHVVFLSLGILSLTGPVRLAPDVFREVFIIIFILSVCGAQTYIVLTQTQNQYDRIAIRNQLIKEAREQPQGGI